MAPLSVGIIGLGRIGAGFDQPDGPVVLTHLKACLSDKRFRVAMLADVDSGKAQREAERFGASAKVATTDELLREQLDVVAIASPDETHLAFAARAIDAGSRAIVVEKPFGGDRLRRKDLLSRSERKKTLVIANYARRFLPRIGSWLHTARAGAFGSPVSARIRYGRGFRHNAIHGIDLVTACMKGEVRNARRVGPVFDDFSPADPTMSLAAELAVGDVLVPLFAEGIDGRLQTVFEVDLVFQRARMLMIDQGGIRARFYGPVAIGNGFAPELRPSAEIADEPPALMRTLWKNVADTLIDGSPIEPAGASSMAADDMIDDILGCLPSNRSAIQ